MKQTKALMGMPITIEIVDPLPEAIISKVFSHFEEIDRRFSPYKDTSEPNLVNREKLLPAQYSKELKLIFDLAEKTKVETEGYFDIHTSSGKIDTAGIVKGWAILEAAKLIEKAGGKNFYVEAGGDIQVKGKNSEGKVWKVGIKNPFVPGEIVKVVHLPESEGIATSGTYLRGQHIYNPFKRGFPIEDIVSLTVIGKNVLEADRFATAAFAMGKSGILFIEKIAGIEGYMIDKNGIGTETSGFRQYSKM